MTEPKDLLERDLERIGASLPVIPNSYGELRALLSRLPQPTPPDLLGARQGVSTDQSVAGTFGSAASPLAGSSPGLDAGASIGILPQVFYGKVNLLGDPMMRNLGAGATTAAFVASGNWRIEHILNSGVLPGVHTWDGRADDISDAGNPLNTDAASIVVNTFNAAGCDLTILLKDSTGVTGFDTIASAAYMLATVRLALVAGFTSVYTNVTSVTVTIELIDDPTGTVIATSTPFDYKAWDTANADGSEVRLTAAYLNSIPDRLEWQLRIRIVSTGAGGDVEIMFGEPQQTHSATELPPPFSPIIGGYVPDLVWMHDATPTSTVVAAQRVNDTNYRFRLLSDGLMKWGPGNALEDVRLQRSAGNVLRFDDNSGLRASLEGAAGGVPVTPAAGFGRLYFSSATKTWHQVDDAGVDKDLGIVAADVTQVSRSAVSLAADYVARIKIAADTTFRGFLGLTALDEGSLELGPGGVAARDLRAFRSAAKVLTLDDTAGGAVTLNVKSTIQQNGTGVSVIGHGAADHADIVRKVFLTAKIAQGDGATAVNIGVSPDLTNILQYADAATQGGFWLFEIPSDWASGVITVQPVWAPGATDAVAHTVRWSIICQAIAAGTTVTAAGTTVTFTGASAARTINVVVFDTATSTTLTPAAAGDLFRINLRRIGADAADTYVGAVNLLGVIVTYTANQ